MGHRVYLLYTYIYLCATGVLTRFYATVESSVMLCITIRRNVMWKLNCARAYCDTAERNLLLILLLLCAALAPYWQSLVHLNCTCVYYNTLLLLLHKIEKIKMAGSIREMSSEMGDNHGNSDLFRLDSSVRKKTRKCAEVT